MTIAKNEFVWTIETVSPEKIGDYLGKENISMWFSGDGDIVYESEEEKKMCAIETIRTIVDCMNLPIKIEEK